MTGIRCILTIWTVFQSPRHWATLCCELLLLSSYAIILVEIFMFLEICFPPDINGIYLFLNLRPLNYLFVPFIDLTLVFGFLHREYYWDSQTQQECSQVFLVLRQLVTYSNEVHPSPLSSASFLKLLILALTTDSKVYPCRLLGRCL